MYPMLLKTATKKAVVKLLFQVSQPLILQLGVFEMTDASSGTCSITDTAL